MRIASPLLVVLALSLTLTGCAPDDDPIVVDPEPSASPIFASDEEALAAAEEAYGAYLGVSNVVTSDGGLEPERIYPFMAESYQEKATEGFSLYRERGWRSEGLSTFDSVTLQQYSDDAAGIANVSIYLCLDVSDVRIFDASNADVTPARDDRLPLEVRFVNEVKFSTDLLQTGSDVWSGDDFCN